MIVIKQSGNFKNMESFLKRMSNSDHLKILDYYGQIGVDALAAVTPRDSGLTASSWGYETRISRNRASIFWTNSNTVDGVPVVILLHYGHGTQNGAFIQGKDFINPSIQPIFDKIAEEIWKEVTR